MELLITKQPARRAGQGSCPGCHVAVIKGCLMLNMQGGKLTLLNLTLDFETWTLQPQCVFFSVVCVSLVS